MLNGARRSLLVVGLVAAMLLVLYPPWRATAVRRTTRYASVPGLQPFTLVDTVEWTLTFAPLYAHPRLPSASRTVGAATGAVPGEQRRAVQDLERQYDVPEVLRSSGAEWRDSILGRAGIPSASTYEAEFTIDRARLALRLATLALLAAGGYHWLHRRRGEDDLDHAVDFGDI